MLKRFSLFILVSCFGLSPLSAAVSTNIRQNTVGFLPIAVKRASILGSPSGNFNVRRAADASIAYTGTLPSAITNADSSESMRIADFSAMTESGTFYLDVAGVGQGPNFDVRSDVYNDPLWVELAGFSIRRCNQAASFTWKGQTYSHAACHLNDAYQDYIGGGHVLKNGKKGWHDAGDFGKYTVNLAFAAGQMLQAWEWHNATLSAYTLPIPESGNGTPDYLNEMRYGLEWLLTMQAANGTVYHKLTATGFEGFILPEADASQRFFVPYSSSATADFCAVMSMAARIYQGYDAAFAAQCQTAATNAWTWLAASPGEVLPNDAGFSTGAYKEAGTDGDHRVWAAAEYWQTTGNAAALSDFETRMAADADKVSTFWDWGEHAYSKRGPKNHGIFTYLLSSRSGRNAIRVADLQTDLMAEADGMVAARNAHGYGRPLGTQYHWGSNGTVARQAMLLDCANQITPTQAYVDTAQDALSHIYGRNMYARSFVSGVGNNPPMNPHDRLSASDGITNPVPGHMAGGPESTANSWTDTQGDFTTNEVAINWDAALVCALAWFATTPPPPTVTPTPTPMPCFSGTALRRVNAGGAAQTTGGNTWSADQAYAVGGWGYTGGAVSTNTNSIAGTTDDILYQSARYGMSSYQFTVPNGAYKVELYMAETYWTGAGQRVLSVTLEGQPWISNLDLYAVAGANTAKMISGSATVSGGILSLGFSSSVDQAEIKAIALYPSVACANTPTFTQTPLSTVTDTSTPTRSPSFSPSPTPSASATRSATASVTQTRSPSPSFSETGTATPSRSPSPSASASPSASSTQTPGNSPSSTSTSTASPSKTASPSVSPSPSRTSSITPGSSPTFTPTSTVTLTSSSTLTASSTPSRSATPSLSPTRTATSSITPGSSPTFTPTSSISPSASPSPSASRTITPGNSPTFTPSSTLSPSFSASPSPSPSGSVTWTITPGLSPTFTPTASASATPTATTSITPGNIFSLTPSATFSLTASDTASATPSASCTPSKSPSVSGTPSSTATATALPVPGSPTSTRTPGPASLPPAYSGGDPHIRQCLPVPQPQSGPHFQFSLFLEGGPADSVQLEVFSSGYNLLARGQASGSFQPGWNYPVAFDLPGLPNGCFFLRAQAGAGGRLEKAGHSFKMVVLR